MRLMLYLFGTLLIFAVATFISHHNGINYDGDSTMGFPMTFHTKGYGQSLDTGQMLAFSRFSFINALIDLICAFLCFTFAWLLLRRFVRAQS